MPVRTRLWTHSFIPETDYVGRRLLCSLTRIEAERAKEAEEAERKAERTRQLLRLMNGESISPAPSAEADDDHEAVDLDACGAADVAADVAAPAPSASAKEAARIAAGKRAGDRRPVAPPGLPIPRGRVPFARPADNPLPRATPEPAPAPLTVPLTAQPSAASAARAAARLEQRDVAADSRKLLDSARASASSAAFRAMAAARATLPAAEARAALLALLREHQVVVVSGETGCGKTTQASRAAPLGRQGRGASHEGGGGGGSVSARAVEAQMRRVRLARRCRSFCSTIASNAWRAARARSSARSLGAHRRRSRLLAANGNPPLVFTSRGSWPRRPSELRPSADCSRLSAISVAERVAAERVEPIGRTVGYQVPAAPAACTQPSPLPHDTRSKRCASVRRSAQSSSAAQRAALCTRVAAARSAAPACAS